MRKENRQGTFRWVKQDSFRVKKEMQVVNKEIDQLVESQLSPISETWRDWRESSELIADHESLVVVRVVKIDEGVLQSLITLNLVGLGMAQGSPELAPGLALSITGTRIKLAEASKDLVDSQNIRGVIAVESPEALVVSIIPLAMEPIHQVEGKSIPRLLYQ